MNTPKNAAFVSLNSICDQWLVSNRKTIHSKWLAIVYAAEAVEMLSLMSLPLLQHTLLTRPAGSGQPWFDLPSDFQDWCSIGCRMGEYWQPLGITDSLLPQGSFVGNGDLGDDLGSDLNTGGDQKSWNQSGGTPNAQFSGNYWAANFVTASTPLGMTPADWLSIYYNSIGRRNDNVTFNPERRQLIVGDMFPYDELYLVYIGGKNLNTMTHLPVKAKRAIMAYIDWQYEERSRDRQTPATRLRKLFQREHRVMRALFNDLTTTDIKQLLNKRFRGRRRVGSLSTTGISTGNTGTSGAPSAMKAYATPPILITTGTAGVTYTISDAIEALWVSRNGVIDTSWTFSAGTWDFTASPLVDTDTVIFIYNKYI